MTIPRLQNCTPELCARHKLHATSHYSITMASESKGADAPAPAPAAASGIDIGAISASFTGHGLYNRLMAAPSVDPSTRDAALVALMEAVKAEGTNLELYEKVCTAAQVPMDDGFVAAAQAKAQQDSLVLERQLNIATANQVRDNIRVRGGVERGVGTLFAALAWWRALLTFLTPFPVLTDCPDSPWRLQVCCRGPAGSNEGVCAGS